MKIMDDVERARELIGAMDHPEWLVRITVEKILDLEDEPAIRVKAVMRRGFRLDPNSRAEHHERIHHCLDSAGIAFFPYMRYVGEGEPGAV